MSDTPCENTDVELWREPCKTLGMEYYKPSVHVTKEGGIGINVGGTVCVKTLTAWHNLEAELADEKELHSWAKHYREKAEAKNKRLVGALEQIANGTSDSEPPFRCINDTEMKRIARQVLKGEQEQERSKPFNDMLEMEEAMREETDNG